MMPEEGAAGGAGDGGAVRAWDGVKSRSGFSIFGRSLGGVGVPDDGLEETKGRSGAEGMDGVVGEAAGAGAGAAGADGVVVVASGSDVACDEGRGAEAAGFGGTDTGAGLLTEAEGCDGGAALAAGGPAAAGGCAGVKLAGETSVLPWPARFSPVEGALGVCIGPAALSVDAGLAKKRL